MLINLFMDTDKIKQSSRYVLLLLSRSATNTFAFHPSEPLCCMFCHVDLIKWTPEDRQSHYEAHLSNLDSLRAHSPSYF